MKKLSISVIAALAVLGLVFVVFHHGKQPTSQPVVGGLYETNPTQFVSGFSAGSVNQYAVDSSGNLASTGTVNATTVKASLYTTATIGSSSTTPAALGSAAAGFIAIGTSTPATRVLNASSTAITINSQVFVQQSSTTTVPNVTCNTTAATSTIVSGIFPGSGFQITTGSVPTTNPNCYYYRIIN